MTAPSTSATPKPTMATPVIPMVIDTTLAPSVFRGLPSNDAEAWFESLEKYANFRSMSQAFLPVVLKDAASGWFDMLADDERSNWDQLRLDNWEKRPSSLSLYLAALEELYGREVVPQFDQQLYQIGFSWENFGTIIQNTFDSLYLRLDQITGYPTS